MSLDFSIEIRLSKKKKKKNNICTTLRMETASYTKQQHS